MNKNPSRALILCADERLARLLENELTALGFAPTVTAAPPADTSPYALLLADADGYSLPDGLPLPAILFGKAHAIPGRENTLYLRRPFGLTDLEDAILRLTENRPVPAEPSPAPLLIFGDGGAVTLAGVPLSLTKGELAILRCLSESNGAPVSRETLAALLGGGGNIVDVYICKLRTKIEKPLGRRIIYTERGVGYRMDSSLFG